VKKEFFMLRQLKVLLIVFLLLTAVGLISADFNYLSELPSGYPLDIDGDTAIVGTKVFVRNGTGWSEQATLIPNRPIDWQWDYFGGAAAIQGDTAFVTSRGHCWRGYEEDEPEIDGSLFIFVRNGTTWTQSQEIPVFCKFGKEIDVEGDQLIVTIEGIYDDYDNYVAFFKYNGTSWERNGGVLASICCGPMLSPVGISGDFAIVYGSDEHSELSRIYKKTKGVWSLHTLLPYVDTLFTPEVDIYGNTAIVGDKVYVTDGTNWTLQATLIPSEAVNNFGVGVALQGDTAIISSSDKSFVFSRSGTTWTQQQKLTVNGANVGSETVDLSGILALVGRYIFELGDMSVDQPLLVNGGFETDSDNNGIPDGWSRKNTTADVRRCNKAGEAPIAFSGNCAYLLKGGSGAKRDLAQNIDLTRFDLNGGDRIRLNGFYNKQSGGDVEVWLFVSYSNLPEQQGRVKMTKTTGGYVAIPQLSADLRAKPTRVRVVIRNLTTSGKTWFDDISLVEVGTETQSDLIPLPLQ
jgi:hypothetical protein